MQPVEALSMDYGELEVGFHSGMTSTILPLAGISVVGVRVS